MPSNMRSKNLCLKHFLERRCALTAKVTSLKLTWKEIKVLIKQSKENDLFPLAFQQRGLRLSESPWHDFLRFWFARCFKARWRRRRSVYSVYLVISEVFALFNFLSCLYKEPLPKILASRLVAILRGTR